MAIRSFANTGTEDINYGRQTKLSLRTLPGVLHVKGRVKLARLHAADSLNDLASLPGNRLEKLAVIGLASTASGSTISFESVLIGPITARRTSR